MAICIFFFFETAKRDCVIDFLPKKCSSNPSTTNCENVQTNSLYGRSHFSVAIMSGSSLLFSPFFFLCSFTFRRGYLGFVEKLGCHRAGLVPELGRKADLYLSTFYLRSCESTYTRQTRQKKMQKEAALVIYY